MQVPQYVQKLFHAASMHACTDCCGGSHLAAHLPCTWQPGLRLFAAEACMVRCADAVGQEGPAAGALVSVKAAGGVKKGARKKGDRAEGMLYKRKPGGKQQRGGGRGGGAKRRKV